MISAETKKIIRRGFFNQCPQCGEGKLLHRFIKPYKKCNNCHLDYEPLRADDGPAWFTILITGHLTLPFALWMIEWNIENPYLEILFPIIYLLVLCALILPRAKGVFMAIIWTTHVRKKTPQQDIKASKSS